MKTSIRSVLFSLSFASALALVGGCYLKDPCGPGFFEDANGLCEADPAPDAGAPLLASADASASEGGEAAASEFGKTCTAQTDCGGDAPVCAAPSLPYCTQISCKPGEANAGVCPTGWTCVGGGSQPTACMKTS